MTVNERLARLAGISDVAGETTRLYLSPAHRRAIDLVSGWMREAGLAVRLDAAATIVGRLDGPTPGAPLLLLGSHIDTIRNAGAFDGTLGVLSAIEALARIRRNGLTLPFAVEILAFGDEEGVRFAPTLAGSRAIAGTFDPASLDAIDADGITLRTALADFGCDVAALAANAERRAHVHAYVELHIEQGPVLEADGLALGVVSGIAGAARFIVTVGGQAAHAGTVPMAQRRDALTGAAEMVLAIRDVARASTGRVVATVGRIEARPGSANVIPGACVFTIDIRAEHDADRAAATAEIAARIGAIAGRDALTIDIACTHEAGAVACHPVLAQHLADAIRTVGVHPKRLPSGAGHDAMAIASLCPIGMIFVRCCGGLSHHPDEHVSEADANLGVAALVAFLTGFGPKGTAK